MTDIPNNKEQSLPNKEDTTSNIEASRKGKPLTGTPQSKSEKQDVIVKVLRNGMSMTTACEITEVSRNCVYKWMKEDEEFNKRVKREQAEGKRELVDEAFRRAKSGSDKLMMFILERRIPEFQHKPEISEFELQILERVIALMLETKLLPRNEDIQPIEFILSTQN